MIAPLQHLRRKALCQVLVDYQGGGYQDVTDIMKPYLISVQVTDTAHGIDKCMLELDDRNAELAVPPDEALIKIFLGWSNTGPRIPPIPLEPDKIPGVADELPFGGGGLILTFTGIVMSIESGFARRGGGRRMWIEAHGGDTKNDGKSPGMAFFTGMTGLISTEFTEGVQSIGGSSNEFGIAFGDVFKTVAASAGFAASIGSNIGSMMRPNWFRGSSESFFNWATRMAAEMGGQVKFHSGNQVAVGGALDRLNVDGSPMVTIDAVWGINLMRWRIKPFQSRPQYGSATSRWFNIGQGAWQSGTEAIGGQAPFGNSKAIYQTPNPAPNAQVGELWNTGTHTASRMERGTGWVIINGEPEAKASNYLRIEGARPGVDGLYQIREAEHNWTRSGGYTTRCDLGNPSFTQADSPKSYAEYLAWLRKISEEALLKTETPQEAIDKRFP